nr:GNAT family N-acetyltransferase [uncultured Sediminibacterium sp.]
MDFRVLDISDIDALLALGIDQIEFSCGDRSNFWQKDELERWLNSSTNFCTGIFFGSKLIGYCLTHINIEISKVMLENIYVAPEHRRKGVASMLLSNTMKQYQSRWPDSFSRLRFVALSLEQNIESIKLFGKCGFKIGKTMVWLQKD